jgi:hyperosmotically inducible protein
MKHHENAYRLIALNLVLVMVLMSLGACATPAGRSSGQVVDDATITTKVKAKIAEENVLRGIAIGVKTFEGDVTLTGAVDTDKQKDRAEELAKNTEGVKNVNNLIKLKSG